VECSLQFTVHVTGTRINETFHRDTAADAITKATAMQTDGGRVFITNPDGETYSPKQFDELTKKWPVSATQKGASNGRSLFRIIQSDEAICLISVLS
jgi:hypothetical protein